MDSRTQGIGRMLTLLAIIMLVVMMAFSISHSRSVVIIGPPCEEEDEYYRQVDPNVYECVHIDDIDGRN